MPRVEIPFPATSSPGETHRTSGGRLVNVICEQWNKGDGTGGILRKRAPGLDRIATSAARKHVRGLISANENELLVVYNDGIEKIIPGAGSTVTEDLGLLPGTKPVFLAKNNADPPHIVAVTEYGVFLLSTSSAPVIYPDGDVGSPNAVCFLDGYFLFTYGDATCLASKINSTDIDVLDSIKAEARSDGLIRPVPFNGQLFLFGQYSCEVNANTAPPTGFAFDRVKVIERGLIAPHAVSGYEDGFTHNLIWVAPDNIVYMLQGYDPLRISNFDVEQAINDLADKSELRAFVYIVTGHPIWCLRSSEWTWCYDLLTSTWHERSSFGKRNWRVSSSCFSRGMWVLGDEETGALFTAKDGLHTDDGGSMEWIIESMDPGTFPDFASIPRVDFDFAAGQGVAAGVAPIETDPHVLIEWSNDGGATWSKPARRSLGKQGETRARVTVHGTGRSGTYGRRWRLSTADPTYLGLVGGVMEVQNLSV